MSDTVKYICINELCTPFPTVASLYNKASIVCYVHIWFYTRQLIKT